MDSKIFINSVERSKKYSILLDKCCNLYDKPPKQKHIRNIIIATYQDENLEGLMLSLKEMAATLNSVSCWKLYYVLHNVMRDGAYNISNFSALSSYLIKSPPSAAVGDFYGVHSQYYRDYLQNKAIFHQKNISIKGNLSIRSGYSLCPYNKSEDGLIYLHNFLKYYEACVWTLDSILKNIQIFKSISITESGQNKLMPVFLLFEDCLGIYKLLPDLFRCVLNLIDDSFDSFFRYGEIFTLSYFKMRQLVKIGSGYMFLENLVQFPQLSSTSPIDGILSDAENKKKLIIQSAEMNKENTLNKLDTPPTVEITKIVNVDKPLPQNIHDECLQKIDNLNQKILKYESMIKDYQTKLQYVKESAINKYKTDMNYATEKLKLLQEENNLIRLEIDEHHKMEQKTSDERLNRLKEMYVELRNEYKKASEQIALLNVENKSLQSESEKKIAKISELKSKIEKLNMELTKCETEIASNEKELSSLKTQTSQGTQQFMAQLEKARQEVEFIQNKYAMETEMLNSQVTNLQSKLDNNNILSALIESLKNRFATMKASLREPSDTECQSVELIAILKILASNADNFLLNSNYDISSTLCFTNDSSVYLNSMVMFAKGVSNMILDPQISDMTLTNSSSLIDNYYQFIDLLSSQNTENMDSHKYKVLLHQLKSSLSSYIDTMKSIPQDTVSLKNATPEDEITTTQHSIQQAKKLMAAVIQEAKTLYAKHEINVNEEIMGHCSYILNLVEDLIKYASVLQKEIIEMNRETTRNIKEFYKKNHRWAEGLISAAKAVAAAAHFLVQTADRTVSGGAPLEELIVASLDISASTAQLIAASRVKAEPESSNLKNLVGCAHTINKTSDSLVSDISNIIRNKNSDHGIDLSKLSVTQTKRLEMNVQIKCLELESALECERSKLLYIRSKNFHAASSSVEKIHN